MQLLLDTHIWLWSLIEPKRLSQRVTQELANPSNELWLSPITTWELIILCQKGRLFLNRPTAEWIADKLATVPVREAPITQQVAMEVDRLQLPHRDPADHFLVATAKVFELILVTSDEHLLNVPEIQVLSNR